MKTQIKCAGLMLIALCSACFAWDKPTEAQTKKAQELFTLNNITFKDTLKVVGVLPEEKKFGVRCDQYYKGMQIIHGDVIFHFNKEGKLEFAGGPLNTAGDIKVAETPAFSKEKAEAAYKARVGNGGAKPEDKTISTVLAIYDINTGMGNKAKEYVLVWYFTNPKSHHGHPIMIIDATSGKTLSFDSGIRH